MRATRTLALCAALGVVTAAPASADFKVQYPDAEPGEMAVETVGDAGHDPRADHNGEKSIIQEFEYGIANFWRAELELEQQRDPGRDETLNFGQVTLENIFQFAERGQYWIDSGFFFEFGKSTLGGTANEVTAGPIFRKEFLGTINTVNLFIGKDVGRFSSGRPEFIYAWETRFAFGTPVEPGFQAYGQPSDFVTSGWPYDNRIGPQLFGSFALGPGRVKWNGGILFGLTSAPKQTLRWQAEYEIHF